MPPTHLQTEWAAWRYPSWSFYGGEINIQMYIFSSLCQTLQACPKIISEKNKKTYIRRGCVSGEQYFPAAITGKKICQENVRANLWTARNGRRSTKCSQRIATERKNAAGRWKQREAVSFFYLYLKVVCFLYMSQNHWNIF